MNELYFGFRSHPSLNNWCFIYPSIFISPPDFIKVTTNFRHGNSPDGLFLSFGNFIIIDRFPESIR